MKKSMARSGVAVLLCLVHLTGTSWGIDITPFVWQFPQVTGASGGTSEMIQQVQEEIQKVLDAGRLSPLRAYYADIATAEEYWIYMEPGRIITTLAWAYPYLTNSQQTAVRSYVAAELASATHAPWATTPMSATVGTRREVHPLERVTYRPVGFAATRPSVHTIYGLWLYGYRTGDWATIQSYWTTIKSMYTSRSAQGDIYGTMSAHIAMARLADRFSDAAARTTALNNAQTRLDAGVTFSTVESRVSTSYWPEMYDARRSQGVYQGWMFLNLSPEIGRYLAMHVNAATLARHTAGKDKYPLWWLRQAPYFCRWTGDEGNGLPTEMMGMVYPIERWVLGASAATLRDYVRSGPTSIGDCYWLEALVQTIEAHGTLTWVDVRNQTTDTLPPAAPRGLRSR